MSNEQLLDKVLEQIMRDVFDGDLTAIAELIEPIDPTRLEGFLPETTGDVK